MPRLARMRSGGGVSHTYILAGNMQVIPAAVQGVQGATYPLRVFTEPTTFFGPLSTSSNVYAHRRQYTNFSGLFVEVDVLRLDDSYDSLSEATALARRVGLIGDAHNLDPGERLVWYPELNSVATSDILHSKFWFILGVILPDTQPSVLGGWSFEATGVKFQFSPEPASAVDLTNLSNAPVNGLPAVGQFTANPRRFRAAFPLGIPANDISTFNHIVVDGNFRFYRQ